MSRLVSAELVQCLNSPFWANSLRGDSLFVWPPLGCEPRGRNRAVLLTMGSPVPMHEGDAFMLQMGKLRQGLGQNHTSVFTLRCPIVSPQVISVAPSIKPSH